MKRRNGIAQFGPNLIFNRESSEQPVICDGIENRLPIRRPCGCQFFNCWRRRYVDLRQQAWPADSDGLPLHQRPRSATRQRFEIRGWRLSQVSAPDFGEDSFGKRMFGVGLDRRGIRDQLVFGRAGRSRDFRGNRASGSRSCRR